MRLLAAAAAAAAVEGSGPGTGEVAVQPVHGLRLGALAAPKGQEDAAVARHEPAGALDGAEHGGGGGLRRRLPRSREGVAGEEQHVPAARLHVGQHGLQGRLEGRGEGVGAVGAVGEEAVREQ